MAAWVAPAVQIGLGLAGNLLGQGDRNAAAGMSQEALQEILGITAPDVEAMKLNLTPYQIQGLLDAINEQAQQVGPSAAENISTDPRLAEAQKQALNKLMQVGETGLTPAEQVQSREMQREVQAQEAQRQAAILQNMKARGVAGSGNEQAARLLSAQNSANQLASSSDKLRAEAFNRALQATAQSGQLGTTMRQQEFGEQERVAQAKDAIANFNAQQRAGAMSRNAAAERTRQATNLSNRQSIANANVNLANEQQRHNKNLSQQDFENRLRRAQAASGAYNTAAQARQGQADATGNMWAGIAEGAGSLLGQAFKSPAAPTNTGSTLSPEGAWYRSK